MKLFALALLLAGISPGEATPELIPPEADPTPETATAGTCGGDVDGDGVPDRLTQSGADGLWYITSGATGEALYPNSVSNSLFSGTCECDVDSDGYDDVLVHDVDEFPWRIFISGTQSWLNVAGHLENVVDVRCVDDKNDDGVDDLEVEYAETGTIEYISLLGDAWEVIHSDATPPDPAAAVPAWALECTDWTSCCQESINEGVLPTHCTMNTDVTSINNSVFEGFVDIGSTDPCKFVSSITLSPKLITIGNGAFSKSGIKDIVIPASVQDIGDYAFVRTYFLQSITFEGNPKEITFGDDVFYDDEGGSSVLQCEGSCTSPLVCVEGICATVPAEADPSQESGCYTCDGRRDMQTGKCIPIPIPIPAGPAVPAPGGSAGECNDGIDNDGDGWVDSEDPACVGGVGDTETEAERITACGCTCDCSDTLCSQAAQNAQERCIEVAAAGIVPGDVCSRAQGTLNSVTLPWGVMLSGCTGTFEPAAAGTSVCDVEPDPGHMCEIRITVSGHGGYPWEQWITITTESDGNGDMVWAQGCSDSSDVADCHANIVNDLTGSPIGTDEGELDENHPLADHAMIAETDETTIFDFDGVIVPQGTTVYLNAYDSYGDGWPSATINVMDGPILVSQVDNVNDGTAGSADPFWFEHPEDIEGSYPFTVCACNNPASL